MKKMRHLNPDSGLAETAIMTGTLWFYLKLGLGLGLGMGLDFWRAGL